MQEQLLVLEKNLQESSEKESTLRKNVESILKVSSEAVFSLMRIAELSGEQESRRVGAIQMATELDNDRIRVCELEVSLRVSMDIEQSSSRKYTPPSAVPSRSENSSQQPTAVPAINIHTALPIAPAPVPIGESAPNHIAPILAHTAPMPPTPAPVPMLPRQTSIPQSSSEPAIPTFTESEREPKVESVRSSISPLVAEKLATGNKQSQSLAYEFLNSIFSSKSLSGILF